MIAKAWKKRFVLLLLLRVILLHYCRNILMQNVRMEQGGHKSL